MLSLEKNFLFLHTPKTGGSAINRALWSYSSKRPHPNETIRSYRSKLDRDVFHHLFKFSITRNPWDRVISAYFYYSDRPYGRVEVKWDNKKFKRSILKTRSMRYYICRYRLPPFWEQQRWIYKNISPLFPRLIESLGNEMDFFLRHESLDEDWKTLCQKLDIPHQPLPRVNVSLNRPAGPHYSEYYRGHPELINLVAEKFKEEIDFFGYSYEQL